MSAENQVMQLATSGRAEDLREDLRLRCLRSLYYFAKVLMDYKDMSPALHADFCDFVVGSIHLRKRGILMPRGHFKSTIAAKAYALWRLLPTEDHDEEWLKQIHNPNFRILMVGESDQVGSKNLKDIKWHIENNQMLHWLFPTLRPDIRNVKWTDTEIIINRTKTFDESSIMTIGAGAKHTGFHHDIIIYDDIIGKKAAESPAEMKSVLDWFQLAPGLLDSPMAEEIVIGTRWLHGDADLYGWIQENLPYNENSNPGERGYGFKWYIRSAVESDEEGNPRPIFPERFDMEALEAIRKREGDYKYACQYLNNPTIPDGADFNPEDIQYYTVAEDGKTLLPCDGTSPIRLEQLLRISFYDPSAGGKSAQCESAIASTGEAPDGRIFALEIWSANQGYGPSIEKWLQMNDKFLLYKNYYEQVGAQKEVETVIKEREQQLVCRFCKKSHRRLMPTPVKPDGRNKEERIRAYAQAKVQQKRLYLRQGDNATRKQITEFPFGKMIDRFDALAYCMHMSRAPMGDTEVKEIKEKEALKKQALPSGRTNTEHNYGGYV